MIKLKDILKEWAEVDTGPKRWGKPVTDKYTEFEKATNKALNEDIPEFSTRIEAMEYEMNKIQKGVRISEREPGRYRAQWSYVRRPLSPTDWRASIKLVTDVGGKIDKEWTRNDYEANYDREEPPEWVPSIYFTLQGINMADKKIKLADLVKGSGFEEIPKKWFTPEDGATEKSGKKAVDMVLPAKKTIVLQADAEDTRGLTIKWTDGKGYEVAYWYGTPDNIVPSEVLADGTSKGKKVKKVTLKYHYKPEEDQIDNTNITIINVTYIIGDMSIFLFSIHI